MLVCYVCLYLSLFKGLNGLVARGGNRPFTTVVTSSLSSSLGFAVVGELILVSILRNFSPLNITCNGSMHHKY